MSENQESKETLKATGIVGGGQVINILIGLVRTKVIAVILGPSGVGVVGLLVTSTDMIRNITSFGLPFSGVRDISIAEGKNDKKEVAIVIQIFIKWVLISAFLGSIISILFCLPLSRFLFHNDKYKYSFIFLSLTVFFTALTTGYSAVLQGKRAIGMMVKAAVVSNIIGSALTIIIYLLLKDEGIILALILASFINLVVTFYFYKRLSVPKYSKIGILKSWHSAKGMIKIGVFTIIVSVFDQIMSLGLRAFISDKTGVNGVGLFTAATTVAGMYLSIVLSSLASDYYPKLASIHDNNNSLHKSMNTQLYIIILLASPFIVGMVGFSDLVMKILYSNKFLGAVDILQWQILGDFFKIISWPCGYIFLAKGLGRLYVAYSISYTVLYMAIIYFGWDYMGFFGIGISFFISQLVGLIFTYSYSYAKFGIYITIKNLKVITFVAFVLIVSFWSHEYLVNYLRLIVSGVAVLFSIIFSFYHLDSVINLKPLINKLLKRSKY